MTASELTPIERALKAVRSTSTDVQIDVMARYTAKWIHLHDAIIAIRVTAVQWLQKEREKENGKQQ